MYNSARNHLPPKGSEPKSKDEPLPVILAGPIVRRCEYDSSNETATVNIWLATSKNFESICAGTLNISTIGELICAAPEISSTFDVVKVSDNFWVWMLKIKFDTNVDSLNEVISQNNRDKTLSEIETRRNNNKVKHIIGGNIFDVDITPPATVSTSVVSPLSEIQQRHISVTPLASKAIYAYDINFLSKKVATDDCDSTCIEENYESQTLTEIMGVDMGDEKEGIKAITLSHLALPIFSVQTEEQSLKCLFGSCRKPHGIGKDASIGMELKLINSILKFGVIDGDKDFPNAQFLTGDQIYADDVHSDLLDLLIEPLAKKLKIKEYLESPGEHNNVKQAKDIRKDAFSREKYVEASKFTSTDSENHLRDFGEFAAMYLIAWNSKLWDQNSKIIDSLKDAYEGTKSIRRVLANVPTYMIIDDHDVTDDFYFDDKWKTEVLKSASGRRLVSHALANYWLFQAWGNTFEGIPDKFSEMINGYTQGNESEKYDYDKTFTEYHKWSFIAPTDPPAIFLNTRTQRKSEIEAEEEYRETLSGPILINDEEYTRLADLVKKDSQSRYENESVIIVSPSPILTLSAVEAGIDLVVKDSLAGDKETFNTNQHTFYQLCQFIGTEIKPAHLIIISGDVHYSTIGFGKLIDLDSKDIYVSQLTSSALKNKVTEGAFYGLWLTIKQIGQSLNKSYYYRRNGRKIESWGQVDGTAKILQNNFSLKYDFVSVGSTRVLYHNRAFLDSNFGFLEKSSSKTTITASIRNSNNEECIGFEGDTKKWPI